MSLHMSLLMVKGDFSNDLRALFQDFDYTWTGNIERHTSFDAAVHATRYPRPDRPRNVVHKAVVVESGWTVVLDPELLMWDETEPCSATARRLNTSVFGALCEGTSGNYGFSYYDTDKCRRFLLVDGKVQTNEGQPITAEQGFALERLFEDDVVNIMQRVGVSYESLQRRNEFFVVELDESATADALPPTLQTRPSVAKPWWRFW